MGVSLVIQRMMNTCHRRPGNASTVLASKGKSGIICSDAFAK